jgi:hypothetical protein
LIAIPLVIGIVAYKYHGGFNKSISSIADRHTIDVNDVGAVPCTRRVMLSAASIETSMCHQLIIVIAINT